MSDPFFAEIRMWACNFAPRGWAQCDGQLMAISQNTALFSLLGTFYGGDGKSTFALPNLQGSTPIHQGQGPGLSLYDLGQAGGSSYITLIQSEMPVHAHVLQAYNTPPPANAGTPDSTVALARSSGTTAYTNPPTNLGNMDFRTLGVAGSSFPHNNMMPFLTVNFCIALQGVFPTRP